MSEQAQALKDFCLSHPEKPEKVSTFEFFLKLKSELRMGVRKREQCRNKQTIQHEST